MTLVLMMEVRVQCGVVRIAPGQSSTHRQAKRNYPTEQGQRAAGRLVRRGRQKPAISAGTWRADTGGARTDTTDHTHDETERDALRATVSAQVGELENARAVTEKRTKLAAQLQPLPDRPAWQGLAEHHGRYVICILGSASPAPPGGARLSVDAACDVKQ